MKYLLTLLLCLYVFIPINATENLVTNTNNDGAGSLREIIDQANEGDTIRFDVDLLLNGSDTILLESVIQFSKSLTIKGLYNESDTLFISGNDLVNIFSISVAENVYLDSLNIIDGYYPSSGGFIVFWSSDSLFISNSTIKNCHSESDGGGVYMHNSNTLILENSHVINNVADHNGGGIYINCLFNDGNLIAKNAVIANNSAGWDGGGIGSLSYYAYNTTVYLENTLIVNNSAVHYGGGVFSVSSEDFTSSKVTVLESVFSANTCGYRGGGLHSAAQTSEVIVKNSTFDSNISLSDGAAISSSTAYGTIVQHPNESKIQIEGSTFVNNSTDGGGVVTSIASGSTYSPICESNVEIKTSTFYLNSSGFLGGIIESGTGMANGTVSLDVQNSTIVHNMSTDPSWGGALVVSSSYDNIPSFTIGSSIVAFNTKNLINTQNQSPTLFESLGYNIFSDSLLEDTIATDQLNIDSLDLNLSELAFNGGSTQTMLPIYPSSAIENGNPMDSTSAQNASITGIREVGAAETCLVTKVDSIFSCQPYTWIDGVEYTESTNMPVLALQNIYGCDSIVSLNFTHSDTVMTQVDSVIVCNSFIWIDGIEYTADTDSAFMEYTNVSGCDSIVYLNLDINYDTYLTDSIVAYESFTWINGNTYFSSNNSDSHTLLSSTGCDSIIYLELTIIDINTDVEQSGITLTSLADSATYQWIDCDNNFEEIAGEISQSFTPMVNGTYAVIISEFGFSDTSECITVNAVGLTEIEYLASVSIFPNPSHGAFTVDLGSLENVELHVYTLDGKLHFHEDRINGNYLLNLYGEEGVYILELSYRDHKKRFRLIKS